MDETTPEAELTEKSLAGNNGKHYHFLLSFPLIQSVMNRFRPQVIIGRWKSFREALVKSHLVSAWLLLLAMPMLALFLQCGLFLFGKTCSPFPIWFGFLFSCFFALLVHWKCMVKFLGLVFLALLFTAYTFSYNGIDARLYHIPMQILLKEGWNPVFDSTIQKFDAIADPSTLFIYHTLFLPRTVALCGALVAQATGLWCASSFLGYLLLFVLFRTSFHFAEKMWICKKESCLFFAIAISFCTQFPTLLDGLNDFHVYASLMITVFSLVLYWQHHETHDYVLAIMATVICSTIKITGLLNCMLFWCLFWLCSWKHKETYWGLFATAFLIAWIGMSPFLTSWIQYGGPFYPLMSFDPKIATVDITNDFFSNVDGEQMGYIARFIYAWISPELATRACALFYHNADFQPDFNLQVTRGVGGFGIFLNYLFCFSLFLLLLAKKDAVSFICLFLLATLFLYPLKYIGYERYFPQVWAIMPLCFYQFCFSPPAWIEKRGKLKLAARCSLLLIMFLPVLSTCIFISAYQIRNMIMESRRQTLLESYRKEGITFDIPKNSRETFAISSRLSCEKIKSSISQQTLNLRDLKSSRRQPYNFEDCMLPHFTQFYYVKWDTEDEYDFRNNPSSFLHFKWLDIFRFFPHPLFHSHKKTEHPAFVKENT